MAALPHIPAPAIMPDRDAIDAQLLHLFGQTDASETGLVEVAWTLPGDRALNRAKLLPLDDLDAIADLIEARSIAGGNVYLSAGLRRQDASPSARASEADVTKVAALWADFDNDGDAQRARQRCEDLGIPPTLVVRTAAAPHTRAQFWWALEEPASDLASTKNALDRLSSVLGGDRVHNLDRQMRAAGSIAQAVKPGRICEVTAILEDWSAHRPPYALTEIVRALDATTPPQEPRRGNLATVLDFNAARPRTSMQERFDASLEPGGWHNAVRDMVGRLVHEGISDESIDALAPAFHRDGYSLEQTRREVAEFSRGARAKGWAPQAGPDAQQEQTKARGWATPYVWRDPAAIPRREWLYGDHFIRRFVTTTMAPGGVGKSALALTEAVAMASGKPILGVPTGARLRVWYWNGEDPLDETERRIAAIALHYRLKREDLEGHLFIGSGRDADLIIAEQTRDGTQINLPNVTAIMALFAELQIDLAIIDPFVSSHRVTENDNGAIDRVAKQWGKVAEAANAGVDLVHHTRKRANPGDETTVEDGRGAVSLLAAARSARVLNIMSDTEADKAGVENRRAYFRVDNGKANLAPPADGSTWYRFNSVRLGNGGLDGGDSVGVVTPWTWPNHLDSVSVSDLVNVQRKVAAGSWRENPQATDWVGHAVGEALGSDSRDKAQKARIKALVKIWLASGALALVNGKDSKGMPRSFIEVGNWVSETPETVSQ